MLSTNPLPLRLHMHTIHDTNLITNYLGNGILDTRIYQCTAFQDMGSSTCNSDQPVKKSRKLLYISTFKFDQNPNGAVSRQKCYNQQSDRFLLQTFKCFCNCYAYQCIAVISKMVCPARVKSHKKFLCFKYLHNYFTYQCIAVIS